MYCCSSIPFINISDATNQFTNSSTFIEIHFREYKLFKHYLNKEPRNIILFNNFKLCKIDLRIDRTVRTRNLRIATLSSL